MKRLPTEGNREPGICPGPVDRIAHDRMTDLGQVNADLVSSAGLEPAFHHAGGLAEGLQHLEVGHRGDPQGRVARHSAPAVTPPEELPDMTAQRPLMGVEMRIPEQARPDQQWPSRAWLRARDPLPDDTFHACALTYVSDMFSGLSLVPDVPRPGSLTSIDHAVWFYRRVRIDEWILMDLQPESVAGGRGMYTGRIFGRDGRLAASIAQESLFRVGDGAGRGARR
jgi:acyl-CoA thioesterase